MQFIIKITKNAYYNLDNDIFFRRNKLDQAECFVQLYDLVKKIYGWVKKKFSIFLTYDVRREALRCTQACDGSHRDNFDKSLRFFSVGQSQTWIFVRFQISQYHRASLWISFPQLRRRWMELVYLISTGCPLIGGYIYI